MLQESIFCCKIQYSGIIISGIVHWKSCDACLHVAFMKNFNSLVSIHAAELMVVHNFLTCAGKIFVFLG